MDGSQWGELIEVYLEENILEVKIIMGFCLGGKNKYSKKVKIKQLDSSIYSTCFVIPEYPLQLALSLLVTPGSLLCQALFSG